MLCQMISDCLGKKVVRPVVKELGITGIVNTLKISLAYDDNFSRIQTNDEITFIPDMKKHIQYMKFFDMFKDLRMKMEKFWKIRNPII